MPAKIKEIYAHLLNGGVIRERHNRSAKYSHCVFINSNPVLQISKSQFRDLSPIFKCKRGIYTLNLNEVRKLNGHSLVKKLYKNIRK